MRYAWGETMKTSDIKQRQQLKNQATGEIVQVSISKLTGWEVV